MRVKLEIENWFQLAGHEAGKLLRSLRDKAHQWWYFLENPEVRDQLGHSSIAITSKYLHSEESTSLSLF
jgi:hypothetical protein